jgi:uncharacterized protein (DUF362 family)
MWAMCAAVWASDVPLIGEPPARSLVVEVAAPHATLDFEPVPEVTREMVRRGILKLTGKPDLKAAWQSVVSPKDVVGLKVFSHPGANTGTRPAVVEAVVQGLLEAGLPPTNIIVWDERLEDLQTAGFTALSNHYGIRLAGSADAGYDAKAFYPNPIPGSLMAGDMEFDLNGATTGRNSYVSKLITGGMTKIISIAPLLNHNLAGVCGNLYSVAMGSVDNTMRFETSAQRLAQAVPEIYALPALSDHVVLNITDALIGQYQGEQQSRLHDSTELNQIWFSKDPVALDALAVQELDREREMMKVPSPGDNPALFQNAALLELGVCDLSKIRLVTAP